MNIRHDTSGHPGVAAGVLPHIGMASILALAAGSCAAKPTPDPTRPSSPVVLASRTPSPAGAAPVAAIAAYQGMWKAYETVAHHPDPTQPELARYATGTALQTIISGIRSLEDQGLKGTGSVAHAPQVTRISPARAPTAIGVSDCMDTTASHIVRAAPGPAYSDSPGGRRLCLATVERQNDGSWKVTTFGVRAV